MRYTWGYKYRGSNDYSVLQVQERNGRDYVIKMVLDRIGLTELQAKAIAMILNAGDPF